MNYQQFLQHKKIVDLPTGIPINKINGIRKSAMPESLEYYEFKLGQAKEKHAGIKSGSIAREHAYSLTYSKKEVNELEKKVKLAVKLWG